jgi:AcrR family transcriptional regulator
MEPASILRPRRRGRPPTPGLRDAILRAAAAVFTRRDFHEVQMDDVVAASGVGKGTVYRYFPSKHDLYLAVMFDGIGKLRAELEQVVRTGDAPARKVERIVRQTLAYFWDQHLFFSLIHRNEHKADSEARQWFRHRAKLSGLIQEVLCEAIGAGQLRRVDARIATEMLLGMMRGVNRYRSAGDRLDDLVDAVVDVFMNGIGTAAGRRLVTAARQGKPPRANRRARRTSN